MTRHWTRPEIDTELLSAAPKTHLQVSTLQRIIDDLLAERDAAVAAKTATPASTWRLPDALGGWRCQIVKEDSSSSWVEVEVLDACNLQGQTLINLRRDQLVETKPASIDDPITLPLIARDHFDYVIKVTDYPPRGCSCIGLVEMGTHCVHLIDEAMARKVARAAWQIAERHAKES